MFYYRAAEYGQVSKELAEPYYLYGRALLELSREKSAMFGKALPGECALTHTQCCGTCVAVISP